MTQRIFQTMEKLLIEKKGRKFKDYTSFSGGDYFLLPFRFHRINRNREVLVSETGDFILVNSGTAQRVIEKQINRYEHSDLYADLISNFIISEESIPPLLEVLATKYRTKKAFLDDFTSLHIFVISLRCDHTCHYCQVSRVSEDRSAFDMQKKHIDKGIEYMMRSPNPYVTMEFQGGESLLAFDNIIYAVNKAKEEANIYEKKITFVVCTNLSPLDEKMLAFFKEHDILISTSLDGPSFVHNQNRHKRGRDSYEKAVEGIKLCRETLGEDKLSALTTITNLSLEYPLEIIDTYFEMGFKSIFLRPISPYGFALRNEKRNYYETSQFLDFYKKALDRIITYNLNGNFFREDYATVILKKILTPFPVGYVDLQSPAGLINNVIVFNYDGKVYASDESRMLAEMNDFTFLMGNLDDDSYESIFYGPKSMQLAQAFNNESLPGCSECAFQSYCGADPVHNYATQGDLIGHRPTSTFCKKNMEIIRYLFELMEDKKVERIFRTWVSGGN